MNIWLRYLAVVTFVGNGFTAAWNLIALGRTIRIGALSEGGFGLIAFNLVFSFAAIALAVLVAAPARQSVSLSTKVIAAVSVVGGGVGALSSAMGLYTRGREPLVGLSTDGLAVAVDVLIRQQAWENAFFSACTLALAILVIASRRSGGRRAVAQTMG